VFEPIHGSWPQAKGQNIANPLAQILSVAMLFEYFNLNEEGALIRKAVDASLSSNVRTPEIQVEGGAKYAWMKEYFPIQYEEVKKYIKTGRWHVSGASWDATDVLIPSIESSLRNIMLGQDYYRKEFGIESTDIFLPDCFGFFSQHFQIYFSNIYIFVYFSPLYIRHARRFGSWSGIFRIITHTEIHIGNCTVFVCCDCLSTINLHKRLTGNY
jgi:hypothetical protein